MLAQLNPKFTSIFSNSIIKWLFEVDLGINRGRARGCLI